MGLWVKDLKTMKEFYTTYFEGISGEPYHNETTNFRSYFLSFPNGNVRLELMNKPELSETNEEMFGYAHIAYQVSDESAVDTLHKQLVDGPRTTGDGYYEAVIGDPEGNLVEITA